MLWEHSRYFSYNWIENLYIKQDFHFKYEWFTWVDSLPGNGMYVVFILLMISALFITLGLFYQISITLFFSSSLTFGSITICEISNSVPKIGKSTTGIDS